MLMDNIFNIYIFVYNEPKCWLYRLLFIDHRSHTHAQSHSKFVMVKVWFVNFSLFACGNIIHVCASQNPGAVFFTPCISLYIFFLFIIYTHASTETQNHGHFQAHIMTFPWKAFMNKRAGFISHRWTNRWIQVLIHAPICRNSDFGFVQIFFLWFIMIVFLNYNTMQA